MEAPQTEEIWQGYLSQNEDHLNIIANGFDWTSYSCQSWSSAFGISYPMLDGGTSGGEATIRLFIQPRGIMRALYLMRSTWHFLMYLEIKTAMVLWIALIIVLRLLIIIKTIMI